MPRSTPGPQCAAPRHRDRGFAMALVVLVVAVLSVMSLTLLDRYVRSSETSREGENLIRVFYANQAGREHALWYLKGNPSTLWYTSPLMDLVGLSWDLRGQFTYQIEDVTPGDSDPVKKVTITGYFPSEAEPVVQRQYLVYAACPGGTWSIRSEFQPGR